MAGLVPAIHVFLDDDRKKDMDAPGMTAKGFVRHAKST
jgi:hypothetical protein